MMELHGRRLPKRTHLDKLITFCFDRADIAFGMADLGDNEFQAADQAYAEQWVKRGNIFAKIRAHWYDDYGGRAHQYH